MINQTEALVAIDINTGKFVGKSNRLEDTIVKTNTDAIKEIVRQIRLRDLGGIIVVDFIDMEERRNREKVLMALQTALEQDKAPSKALSFNEFGLVCITRKRTKQALERVLCQPCPYCTGSGMVKSIPTLCYEIQAEARKMAMAEHEGPNLTLRVHPEIAKALKTRESILIDELEQWSGQLTAEEVQAIFDRHGVPSSPYRTVKEAMADPQLAHRHAFAEIHDAGGAFLALNPPFRISAARAAAVPHVAVLGEHSEELLGEIGYPPAQIAELVNPAKSASRA